MTLRQRARAARPDPNRWYPACWSQELGRETVREVVLWDRSIALFRDVHGVVHALANRCAHRPVPLTLGEVRGCELVCPYHGWSYAGDGALVDIPHTLFGKKKPRLRVPRVATRERYGLVWIFGGDPELADRAALPRIEPLDGGWPSIGIDAVWKAHHSAVIDTVLDLTHDHLHRRFQPFTSPELEQLDIEDQAVHAHYRLQVGAAPYLQPFLPVGADMSAMTMSYIYPHHCSNTGGVVRHWTLVRPIDVRTTHVYVVFAVRGARIPGTRRSMPRALVQTSLPLLRQFYIAPLFEQDRAILEAEQRLHEADPGAPAPELNPVVRAVHQLAVRCAPDQSSDSSCLRKSASAIDSSTSSRCASSR